MINIISITITYLATYISSYLSHHLLWSSPFTISTLGLIGSFYSHQGKIEKGDIQALIIIGAFAGTTPEPYFHNQWVYIFTSILIFILFRYLKHKFVGYGGKLGLISFISCWFMFAVNYFFLRIFK